MFVPGKGPIPCEWLILGEAPGAKEAAEGRPFVGASGDLLDAALGHSGVARGSVFITNAYKLRPPGNRNPTATELELHRNFLDEEFKTVSPKYVLTLGNVPLQALCPDAPGITRARGQWIDSEEWNVRVYPTYHPAYVLRNGVSKEVFFEDIRDFFRP